MNISEKFLFELKNLSTKKISPKVINRAKQSLLDYIGVTLAGGHFHKKKIDKYFEFLEQEKGIYSAIGINKKISLKDAVFLNGLNGHALDFDDGTNTGIIHLGSPIFSVLLPLAQKYKVDSEKFLKAAVIGYEASFTIAVSIQPKHKELGYHATGTCGILGVVVAVAYMLDFNEKQTKNAFSTACVSATGMLKVLDDNSELKPYNVAKSALLGLVSVQMAKAGFIAHPDPLGGSRGFLKMMTGGENITLKSVLLNDTYAIEKTYTKPYAACRYCHPAIEAAINIKNKYKFDVSDIDFIEVRTYYWAVNKHDHTNISNISSAKMSIPYGVAVGLIFGKAGLQEYEQSYIDNKKISQLASKVCVLTDDALSTQFPTTTTAILNLKMVSNIEIEERVDFPKGEPENPLTGEEFISRFIELSRYGGKTEKEAQAIINFINNMDGNMEELFKYL